VNTIPLDASTNMCGSIASVIFPILTSSMTPTISNDRRP